MRGLRMYLDLDERPENAVYDKMFTLFATY